MENSGRGRASSTSAAPKVTRIVHDFDRALADLGLAPETRSPDS